MYFWNHIFPELTVTYPCSRIFHISIDSYNTHRTPTSTDQSPSKPRCMRSFPLTAFTITLVLSSFLGGHTNMSHNTFLGLFWLLAHGFLRSSWYENDCLIHVFGVCYMSPFWNHILANKGYLFGTATYVEYLAFSHLNLIINPTPLPNATLTIGATARNPNYWGSHVYPNYRGSHTQP
jgi:hypothetical protein